jgi:hypothetical protein
VCIWATRLATILGTVGVAQGLLEAALEPLGRLLDAFGKENVTVSTRAFAISLLSLVPPAVSGHDFGQPVVSILDRAGNVMVQQTPSGGNMSSTLPFSS